MQIAPWVVLLLAFPVILFGESVLRNVRFIRGLNVPSAVIGGLFLASIALALKVSKHPVNIEKDSQAAWTWLVLAEPEWINHTAVGIHCPFLMAFFACLGLNASSASIRSMGGQLAKFLIVAAGLACLQSGVGVAVALALNKSPILGLICGSVTMTGGIGTSLGFADVFKNAGFHDAAAVGTTAATLALVTGSVITAPLAGFIVQRVRRRSSLSTAVPEEVAENNSSFKKAIANLFLKTDMRLLAAHLLLLLSCIKIGAWTSFVLGKYGIHLPVYLGVMMSGVLIRNALDACKISLRADIVQRIIAVCVQYFLALAIIPLDLSILADTAGPMLIIFTTEVFVTVLYVWTVTRRAMGGTYEACVLAAGHFGFAVGTIPIALATLQSIQRDYGVAPRASVIISLAGGVFIDFINAGIILFYLNLIGT